MELYLSAGRSGQDWTVVDENGTRYTSEQARALYERGQVSNSNLAFLRLINADFDLVAVRHYYEALKGA